MKCVNCDSPAVYVWSPSYTDELAYCSYDLPRFLYPLKEAGLLQKTETFEERAAEVSALLAEELIEEEAPAPRRKRSPRTSVNDESNQDAS